MKDSSSVLTSNDLVPHLSRRKYIKFINDEEIYDFEKFDEILLDREKPGWKSNKQLVDNIYKLLESNNNWNKIYEKNSIVLFEKLKN